MVQIFELAWHLARGTLFLMIAMRGKRKLAIRHSFPGMEAL